MQEKQGGEKTPTNTVSLLTAAVKDGPVPCSFSVVSPQQKAYVLQAESEQDVKEWMAAIQVCPGDYDAVKHCKPSLHTS